MSAHEAVDALRSLGLSNYEAQVFVALQQLGTGTAQEVSRRSEVPRSQVYGAADDLADRGLVELVESSPKTFRPVGLETARDQLRMRIERQQETAFEHLDAIQNESVDESDERQVSTLRGRQPIYDRIVGLVGRADDQVVFVGATDTFVDEELAAALRSKAASGAFVMAVSEQGALTERFEDSDVRVITSAPEHSDSYTGRTLLVDEATILLSVPTAEDGLEPFEEVALWTADTSIGRILARFVHAGMEHGLDDEYPASIDPDVEL
jgi:sugar-specific transcriptional regulator TrmB